uniref:Atos-like conserved domain-containing protein n=1 Tax=Dromaius novaehollandiae TaxID=8790 RepID=A0A8C4P9P9_DRONO
MRHIHAEASLPPERSTDSGLSRPGGEAALEPSSQCCTHRSILMGYNETEIKRQKVYQVSIFSHLSSSSENTEQRTGSRPAIKRGYPEQRTPEGARDPKRTHWGGGGVDGKWDGGPGQGSLDDDDAFEDGLLVEELSLCGSAQHFSHSGLRVVEHRCEGSPSHSPKASREERSQDASSSWPQHIACSTLHTRDSCPAPPEDQPGDYGENGERASGHNLLELDLHNIAQTPQAASGGKREKPESSPAHSSRTGREGKWLVMANGCKEPPAPQTALSPEPSSLSSSEKTPCGSSRLSGRSCPAKRKLLPAGEVAADSCSEDESLSPPARKKRALPCHPVPTACRSTDAKGAPFWNHLLPAAKSSADCTTVGRRLKSGLRLKSRHLRSSLRRGTRPSAAPWTTTTVSHALLGNFEESILKGRFAPSGRIEGFTAEIGASGSYCPQHATLPVDVTYFDISEHSAPSPFLACACPATPLGQGKPQEAWSWQGSGCHRRGGSDMKGQGPGGSLEEQGQPFQQGPLEPMCAADLREGGDHQKTLALCCLCVCGVNPLASAAAGNLLWARACQQHDQLLAEAEEAWLGPGVAWGREEAAEGIEPSAWGGDYSQWYLFLPLSLGKCV